MELLKYIISTLWTMSSAILIQMQPSPNGKEASFEKARRMVLRANPTPGSLILLPEMFATGFVTDPAPSLAENLETSTAETPLFLQALADETRCSILGGGIESISLEKFSFRNWTGLFEPGKTLPKTLYRKRHPFADEARLFAPGKDLASFDWDGFRVFPFICFDLRFPEDFRKARALGASLLTVQAEWPASRALHLKTLLRARAIENQCYVLACSRAGEGFATSSAFGPNGEELLDANFAENVFCISLDLQFVQESRKNFPLPNPAL